MKLLKIYALLIVLLTIFPCSATRIDPNYNYQIFMMQFGRNYTGQEKTHHQNIFDQNYAKLLSLMKQGQDVEVNNLLDWNETQKQMFLNFRPDKLNIPVSQKPLKSSFMAASLPSYDWRTYDRVTQVRDQKSCGSCWAFATTAQYESLLMMSTNGTRYDLAEQYALECDKASSGCDGGNPFTAINLIKNSGIPLETSYPYHSESDRYYQSQSKPICTDSNRIKISQPAIEVKHYRRVTEEELQQYLIDYGPLTVGIDASSLQFQGAGASGVVSCPPSQSSTYVNHAVLLVGYNTTHWFIKNSWSAWWGNKGFGYIDKKNDCNLHTSVDILHMNFSNSVNPPAPTPSPTPTPTPTPNPPNPSPTPGGSTVLIVTLSSQSGNGWGGNILGFKQNNVVVATFGQKFTYGSSFGPTQITINGNVTTQIVVVQRGNLTSDIGFTIKYSNGNMISQRSPGNSFAADTIFETFCPGNGCPSDEQTVTYYLTMTDTYGDGWNGNVLGFRQNGITQNFTLPRGRSSGPTPFQFQKYTKVDIVVVRIARYTTQIGFELRTSAGLLVYSVRPGTRLSANILVGTFCPECTNLSPVQIVGSSEQVEPSVTPDQPAEDKQKNSYRTATIVLTVLSVILVGGLAFTTIKLIKMREEIRSKGNMMEAPMKIIQQTLEDMSSAKSQQVFTA